MINQEQEKQDRCWDRDRTCCLGKYRDGRSSEGMVVRLRQTLRSKLVAAAAGWPETVRARQPRVMTQKSACATLMETRRQSEPFKNRRACFSC